MSNMSYCRFHNTKMDLNDCLYSLQEEGATLSGSEAEKGIEMFTDFLDFCQEFGIIKEYDRDKVEAMFNEMNEDKDLEEDEDE